MTSSQTRERRGWWNPEVTEWRADEQGKEREEDTVRMSERQVQNTKGSILVIYSVLLLAPVLLLASESLRPFAECQI